MTKYLTKFCASIIWKGWGWEVIVLKGINKPFCWEMFSFSKLIKNSAKKSSQFCLVLQKVSAGRQKDASSPLLRRFATTSRRVYFFQKCRPNTLQVHFYGIWSLTTLGRTAGVGIQLVNDDITWRYWLGDSWRRKLNSRWDYWQWGDSNTISLSWSLDSSSCTDLHRGAWRESGPALRSDVRGRNSQYSVPWCQHREHEPAES